MQRLLESGADHIPREMLFHEAPSRRRHPGRLLPVPEKLDHGSGKILGIIGETDVPSMGDRNPL